MMDNQKFRVMNPFTGDEATVEFIPQFRRWTCTRCGVGPKCIHADAIVSKFEVEQVVEVTKKRQRNIDRDVSGR